MKFAKKAAVAAIAFALTGGTAAAQYPEKPVKIVVGFSAGGGTDTTARGFASYMHEAASMKGMPAFITNIPGASGQKGAKMVAEGDKDGYTLYMINMGTLAAGELAKGDKAPFNAREDFVVLGCMSQLVTSMLVHVDDPATTAKEWLDKAKASGETIKWSSSGATSMHTLIGTLLLDELGIPHQAVPFKGGSKGRAALISKSVPMSFLGVHLSSGFENDVKNLGVAGSARDPINPDVMTFAEQGLPEVDVTGPMCLFAPAGVPDDAIAALEAAVKDVAGIKGFAKFMKKSGLAAFHIPRADAVAKLDSMYGIFKPLVAQALAK